jgi:hypothetical protein
MYAVLSLSWFLCPQFLLFKPPLHRIYSSFVHILESNVVDVETSQQPPEAKEEGEEVEEVEVE